MSNGGPAPRMLCLDDYFMVETDKEVMDTDTGKKVKKKVSMFVSKFCYNLSKVEI